LTPPNANLRGIAAMCFAMAAFMINDTGVKLASKSMSVGQVALLRGLMCCAMLAVGLLIWRNAAELRHLLRPIVAFRCCLEGFIALSFIGALALLPISTATAVLLSSPLLITVAAALFMGENVRLRRWLAVGTGFAGMLIVVRPTPDGFNAGVGLALLSTVLAVMRDLITRKLPHDVPTGAVAAGAIVMATAAGGVFALTQPWRPVEPSALAPLAMASIAVTAGNYAIIVAFRSGEVSVVSPFRYTLMLWGVAAGYLVFGHWPDATTWLGILLIVGSGLFILYREARLAYRGSGVRD
jgi:drug/metabolite transporter (DMT)-like permease